MPDAFVAPHIERQELVRVLEPYCKPFPEFYLYHQSRTRTPPALRALITFLQVQTAGLGSDSRKRLRPVPNKPHRVLLDSPRNGVREEIGHLADAGRHETAFRPDETYISGIAHKFLKDSNDIGMANFISKGTPTSPAR